MKSDSYMLYIYVAVALLAIDAALSIGLVTSMVNFLHTSGQGPFQDQHQRWVVSRVWRAREPESLNQGTPPTGREELHWS